LKRRKSWRSALTLTWRLGRCGRTSRVEHLPQSFALDQHCSLYSQNQLITVFLQLGSSFECLAGRSIAKFILSSGQTSRKLDRIKMKFHIRFGLLFCTLSFAIPSDASQRHDRAPKELRIIKRNHNETNSAQPVVKPDENHADNNKVNSTSELISPEREFPGLKVQTECQRDKSLIRVNFTKPFYGIIGVGKLETTKCKLTGTGEKFYQLEVRHSQANDCDTQWENSTTSLVSSFFIRRHLHLETGSDVSMTVMCKLAVGDLVVGPSKRKAKSNRNTNRNN